MQKEQPHIHSLAAYGIIGNTPVRRKDQGTTAKGHKFGLDLVSSQHPIDAGDFGTQPGQRSSHSKSTCAAQ